jgi:hypothetical protein
VRKGVLFGIGLALLAALTFNVTPARAMALAVPAALNGASETIDATETVHYYGYYRPYRHYGYYRPYRYYRHYRPYRHYGYYRPYRYYRPYVPAPWVSGPWGYGYGPRYFHVGPWIGWY